MEFQPVGHVNVYLPKQVTNIVSPGKFIQFYVGKLLWFKKLLACRLSILQLTYTLVKKKVFNIYFIHLHYNITVLCVDDKHVCKLLVKDTFHMLMIPLYILFIDNKMVVRLMKYRSSNLLLVFYTGIKSIIRGTR